MNLPDNSADWVSVSDLARRMGISRQSMSERVDRFEAAGALTTRKHGRRRMVDAKAFAVAAGEAGDPSKDGSLFEANAQPQAPAEGGYSRERAKRERALAEMAELDLAERKGELIPVAHVTDAAVTVARDIRQRLDRIVAMAEDLAGAADKGGAQAVRAVLKDRVRAIETYMADAMARMTTTARGADDGEPDDGE